MRGFSPLALVLIAIGAGGCKSDDCRCGTEWTPSALSCSAAARCEGAFELVGHSPLMNRGMNAGLAVVGDHAYVGSRADGFHEHAGVLIVDLADPAAPQVVGEIGRPDLGLEGVRAMELRAIPDKNLLAVMNIACSYGNGFELDCGFDLNRFPQTGGVAETSRLKLYDITDRVAPRLVGTYDFGYHPAVVDHATNPHEFFVWRDPLRPERVLLYVSALPGSPNLLVLDVTDPTAPALVLAWDSFEASQLPRAVGEGLHSVAVSDDGRTVYLAHFGVGFYMLDSSTVADADPAPRFDFATPIAARVDFSPPYDNFTHSAVPIPGRDLVLVTHEVYPVETDYGCPWGWGWLIDVANRAQPRRFTHTDDDDHILYDGQMRLAENDSGRCQPEELQSHVAFSSHNPTLTEHLALVTWHSGGLQAFDTSDPSRPTHVGAFYPQPLDAVATEDPNFDHGVVMWSYPIVKNGLIYAVDVRNGLYVLRYSGPRAEEVSALPFLEGNSNLR
jgi:hypothetical protein